MHKPYVNLGESNLEELGELRGKGVGGGGGGREGEFSSFT